MKKILTTLTLAMLLVACSKENITVDNIPVINLLNIGIEESESRVHLNDSKVAVWDSGDLLSVFYKNSANGLWRYSGTEGEQNGVVIKVSEPANPSATFDAIYAVYPYNENTTISGEGIISFTIPAEQTFLNGSYGKGDNIMVAVGEGENLSMKNIFGWVRIPITGTGQKISGLVFKGNNSEILAGAATIDPLTQKITFAEGDTKELTLNCNDVTLEDGKTFEFYIAVTPQTFSKGFTVDIMLDNGDCVTKTTTNSITIGRNHICPMGSVSDPRTGPYTSELWYTNGSTTKATVPNNPDAFGANIVSNTYDAEKKCWIIKFDDEVTKIGDSAFKDCTSLTSVTVGNSVTPNRSLLDYCASLASVSFGDSVTLIGDYAFNGCTSLAKVTIPNSVTSIGNYAFDGCTSLASVTIPNSVDSIGDCAFKDCTTLKDVYYEPSTPPTLGCSVFDNNADNRKIYVPASDDDSVINAYQAALSDYADDIKELFHLDANNEIWYTNGSTTTPTTPSNPNAFGAKIVSNTYDAEKEYWVIKFDGEVTKIGDYAFNKAGEEQTSTLTSVIIPDGVTSIGLQAFGACITLTNVTIPNSVTSIGQMAFMYCSSLTSVTIPDSVTLIDYNVFNGCTSLTNITIPDSVTSIKSGAFSGCTSLSAFYGKFASADNRCFIVNGALMAFAPSGLTTYTIPEGVTSIEEGAFRDCTLLTSITIPDSVTKIGQQAFAHCTALSSVTIPESVTEIGHFPFSSCNSLSAFYGKFASADNRCLIVDGVLKEFAPSGLTTYAIPDGVTSIGYGAFSNSTLLTSITIPDSVTKIGQQAFEYCTALSSVTIPDGVTSIGQMAFKYCSSLTSVTIPDSVTSIGNYAFYNCSSLASVTIGNNVTSIGDEAFFNCILLKEVHCKPTIPPTGGSRMFDINATGRKIYVPDSDDDSIINAYKTAENWNTYANYIIETSDVSEYKWNDIATGTWYSGLEVSTAERQLQQAEGTNLYRVLDFWGAEGKNFVFTWDSTTNKCDIEGMQLSGTDIGHGEIALCDILDYYLFAGYDYSWELLEQNGYPQPTYDPATNTFSFVVKYTLPTKGIGYGYNGVFEEKFVLDGKSQTSEIWYTNGSTTEPTTPSATDVFGANIVSNTYNAEKGCWIIKFDGEVTKIGEKAFYECKTLSSVTIPNSVTSIEQQAFAHCTALSSVTIPDGVTTIGLFAFHNCDSLTSVTIPESVTEIGHYPFSSCNSLSAFYGKFASADNRCLIVDGVLKEFAPSGLTTYTIPDGVTSIGYGAFSNSTLLTSITIPDSVTKIEQQAFEYCTALSSVTIPDGVTSIEYAAFRDCTSLTSATIGNSVTTIGTQAFINCASLSAFYGKFASADNRCLIVGGKLKAFAPSGLTTYAIPEGVTAIGNRAFYGCDLLESITICGVQTIEEYAFGFCDSLKSVTISGVQSIGNSAFYYCSSLKEVYCKPLTPPALGRGVFDNNATDRKIYVPTASVDAYKSATNWSNYADYIEESSSLNTNGEIWYTNGSTTEPTVPYKYATNPFGANIVSNTYDAEKGCWVIKFDGEVTKIGASAFWKCTSLKSITIPDSVSSIAEQTAFYDCYSLSAFYGKFASADNRGLIVGGQLIAFAPSGLTAYAIPDGVTSIGNYAFRGCSSLANVTIPDSVTSIGNYAFLGCSSLANVTIPDSVTTIGSYAFRSCSSLANVTIPDSVTSIRDSAFSGCSSLANVTIPDSVTSIGDSAFSGCTSLSAFYGKFASADNRCLIVGGKLIAFAPSGLTAYAIPDSVTSIGYRAFYNCSSLANVTIPDSVTSIGNYAFYNCSSLASVTIGNNVTSIGNYAFRGCTSLTSVTIPDSVTSIGEYAFSHCSSLANVTIPNNVTSIGDYAFNHCSSLKDVYCKPTIPPTGGTNMFLDTASGRKIYVPTASVDAYKSATNWSKFANYIVGYDF